MYLSLSVNIHQSYRFKMNVKLDIPNWNFSQFKVGKNPTGYFKLANVKNS